MRPAPLMDHDNDTIAAIATAAGMAGVGVVRVSGPLAPAMAQSLLGRAPRVRHAHLAVFRDATGETIDHGLLLYFPAPASYTGEDVLELQGHGGPVVTHEVLAAVLDAGARLDVRDYLLESTPLAWAAAPGRSWSSACGRTLGKRSNGSGDAKSIWSVIARWRSLMARPAPSAVPVRSANMPCVSA